MLIKFGTLLARGFTLSYGKYYWHGYCKGQFENDYHYHFGSPYVQKSLLERFGLSKSFGGETRFGGGCTT